MLPIAFINDFFNNFDVFFNDVSQVKDSYPKYNIIKEDDETIILELALAGYSKEDIDINVSNNILHISGGRSDEERQYLRRGIANRSFSKRWTLPTHMEVRGASLDNGLLRVLCKLEIPEQAKPKQISIT